MTKIHQKYLKMDGFVQETWDILDKNNNIYIEDRLDNMIIVSGENIYPSEIEKFYLI